jgi:hypothetical protein
MIMKIPVIMGVMSHHTAQGVIMDAETMTTQSLVTTDVVDTNNNHMTHVTMVADIRNRHINTHSTHIKSTIRFPNHQHKMEDTTTFNIHTRYITISKTQVQKLQMMFGLPLSLLQIHTIKLLCINHTDPQMVL